MHHVHRTINKAISGTIIVSHDGGIVHDGRVLHDDRGLLDHDGLADFSASGIDFDCLRGPLFSIAVILEIGGLLSAIFADDHCFLHLPARAIMCRLLSSIALMHHFRLYPSGWSKVLDMLAVRLFLNFFLNAPRAGGRDFAVWSFFGY